MPGMAMDYQANHGSSLGQNTQEQIPPVVQNTDGGLSMSTVFAFVGLVIIVSKYIRVKYYNPKENITGKKFGVNDSLINANGPQSCAQEASEPQPSTLVELQQVQAEKTESPKKEQKDPKKKKSKKGDKKEDDNNENDDTFDKV